jgi:hypothetical protein
VRKEEMKQMIQHLKKIIAYRILIWMKFSGTLVIGLAQLSIRCILRTLQDVIVEIYATAKFLF